LWMPSSSFQPKGSGTRRRSPSSRSARARRGVLAEPESLRGHAVASCQARRRGGQLLEGGGCPFLRPDEVLHLHLLELSASGTRSCGDLVAEGLADLRDARRDLLARALLDVLGVTYEPCAVSGAEVDDRGVVLHWAHVRGEHQVEPAGRRQRAAIVREHTRPRRSTMPGGSPRSVALRSSAPGSGLVER
jgi:hypothetical protein